jgi:molybdenum cofactor cytidylyltransferase
VSLVEGILLAAGESRRMGYPKPLLKVNGVTFIEKISSSMLEVVQRLVIVLGAHAERIRPAIPHDERIAIVENPNYERGQLSSLKVGLEAVSSRAEAALVHLGDHPLVRAESFKLLTTAYEESGTSIVIAIARNAGRRGHPLIFERSIFPELLGAPENEGARYVVNQDAARVLYVDLEDPGINLDLDTPADLELAGLAPPPGQK